MREATAANFKDVIADNPVVLVDFHATWCGPCKAMEPALAAIDGSPLPVVKVDIEAAPEIAQTYGVRSVPTLIVFKDGEVVDMKVGAQSPSSLKSWTAKFA